MAESFEDRVIGCLLVAYKEADPDGRFKFHELHNFDDLSMNSIDSIKHNRTYSFLMSNPVMYD